MKRIITALAALFCASAFGTTYVPVQLLNPTGSTSGQVVLSNGPVTAPGWGNVAATSLAAQAANTVVANVTGSSASPTAFPMPSCSAAGNALNYQSGTGFNCATGLALTSGATFTGSTSISYSSPIFVLNDSTSAAGPSLRFRNSGTDQWEWKAYSSNGTMNLGRWVSGTYTDNPISVSPSTGAVTMTDGITNSPISGSTGSFTTLAASSTLNVTGAATLTGGIVGATNGSTPAAGIVGQILTNTTTGTALTSGSAANATSLPLTAGYWLVWGNVQFVPASTTTVTQIASSINTTSANLGNTGNGLTYLNATFATGPANEYINTGFVLVNVSSGTTAYLVSQATFGTSTMTVAGSIFALRVR